MPEISLPSGGTVHFAPWTDLKGRDRRAVELAVADAGVTTETASGVVAAEVLAARSIVAWELPYAPDAAIPTRTKDAVATLGDVLDGPDWHAVVMEAVQNMARLYSRPDTPDDAGVPGSPTSPDGG